MKKMLALLVFPLLAALSACEGLPKNTLAMCHDPAAIADFAAFANDKKFRDAHLAPLPGKFQHTGEMVDFPTEGGNNARAYAVRPNAPTDKYLLLLHEWWGLNDYVKREAEFWCEALNINVLALDLYDGEVAATPDDARRLMQSNTATRSEAIIAGAFKFAGDKADFRTMGWCFGGGWSLQTALLAGDRLRGCVMFYGMPEKDVEKLRRLTSDVMFIHARRDKWISDAVVEEFEQNMRAAERTLTVHAFDADHAFANPSNPRYDAKAAEEARNLVRAYLLEK